MDWDLYDFMRRMKNAFADRYGQQGLSIGNLTPSQSGAPWQFYGFTMSRPESQDPRGSWLWLGFIRRIAATRYGMLVRSSAR